MPGGHTGTDRPNPTACPAFLLTTPPAVLRATDLCALSGSFLSRCTKVGIIRSLSKSVQGLHGFAGQQTSPYLCTAVAKNPGYSIGRCGTFRTTEEPDAFAWVLIRCWIRIGDGFPARKFGAREMLRRAALQAGTGREIARFFKVII